ncbi:MAG: asparagine synthase (glutamine-hydrolyzing) [Chitinophagaceae bacterium]|nr:asparagine synthase (glutamine-hydrolyzing) [Chitinophagaceae bacterium]
MCGIAGILYFNDKIAEQPILKKMNSVMAHRGPDAEGIYCEGQIGLCHRRLSVIDLSVSANQPYFDNSNRYVIVFNGEVYNYQTIKQQIESYSFKTSGDTETLVAAYAQWGVSCVSSLKGMFAFAIWDRQTKELFLVRDRMGVKPLYYYIDDEKLIFASEIRTILSTGLVPQKLNQKAVYEYLSYQSVSFPGSIVENVLQLDAGAWMKVKDGKIQIEKYWNCWDTEDKHDYTDARSIKNEIRDLLGQSVQRRLVSDVPVGAFLSGGIDSSVVVGLMAEMGGIRPSTFNISFGEKEFDESVYAEMVAKKFNTDHTRIQLSPDVMLHDLEDALSALDTPSGDGVNTYVVSKAIKNAGITVALSGVGGDELFAGYPIFGQFKKVHALTRVWNHSAHMRNLVASCIPGRLSNRQSRIRQMLRTPKADIEYIYPLLRQLITPEQVKEITALHITGGTALSDNLKKYSGQLHKLPVLSQVSAAEYMGYTQHTLLKDTDQMSMAVALEVREPFFDTDLVQYVLGIPDQYKQPVYPKSLLVESVKPLLPDEIVFRKKQGFVFPWKKWMRNELRTFCSVHLNRLAQRGFIKSKSLINYWERFLKGDDSIRWMDIWVFIVLEYWLEKNGIE